jgi:hypothetical protein
LKEAAIRNAVPEIADPYKPYVLETDASDYAQGAFLSEEDSN